MSEKFDKVVSGIFATGVVQDGFNGHDRRVALSLVDGETYILPVSGGNESEFPSGRKYTGFYRSGLPLSTSVNEAKDLFCKQGLVKDLLVKTEEDRPAKKTGFRHGC